MENEVPKLGEIWEDAEGTLYTVVSPDPDTDDRRTGDVYISKVYTRKFHARRVVVHTYSHRDMERSTGDIWIGVTEEQDRGIVRWAALRTEDIDDLIVALEYAKLISDNPELRPEP